MDHVVATHPVDSHQDTEAECDAELLGRFHPVIADWFRSRFAQPSDPQKQGWPVIQQGRHTLISAPTGSGKTLTAFLAVIDRLFRRAIAGMLPNHMHVVYVSPLRALSNDMHKNLITPLAEITALAKERGYQIPDLTIGLRTGDTPANQRAAMTKKPPHILVTTPESLYLMISSEVSRKNFASVETLIVDEIHALIGNKRGSHHSLSVERLEYHSQKTLQRIGLSATQRPIEQVADFLLGNQQQQTLKKQTDSNTANEDQPPLANRSLFEQEQLPGQTPDSQEWHCLFPPSPEPKVEIINVGSHRKTDLGIVVPESPLQPVCSHEQWEEIHQQLVKLIHEHRSTLIFVNTRRMAERIAHQLSAMLGEDHVSSHHGSLAADIRLETEQKLKEGQLKAVVATASLELGIDVGFIDLVVQIGSSRAIATFLQRIGRSGHALGLTPKGRLFALTRDELLECMGMIRAVKAGRLDRIIMPEAPVDVLTQQLVAEVACQEWGTDELYQLIQQAYPYRELSRERFDELIQMLSEGLTPESGRGQVYLHHDQINKRVRARKAARIVALNNAGSIPDIGSYRVVVHPDQTVIGSVDEDFAVESSRGDIFLLGNNSWRIEHVRGNDVTVSDAQGAPPTIPFWRGEAPGRTLELSDEVSSLRQELEQKLRSNMAPPAIVSWLKEECCAPEFACDQIVDYVQQQLQAVGLIPTQTQIIFERFFDETGGMQLVVHAPFGSRITKAWGLAMRKRFCRSFDFELQATADDDGFILSLGPQHSFAIESLFPMLTAENCRNLLEQALIYIPTFQLRWRWAVTNSLLVQRRRNGQKVPPALQRFRSDDLLTAVFPKLTGCQEEHTGDHEIPDHPLVQQTMEDCLFEALDLPGLIRVLKKVAAGEITFIARDTRQPSPFSHELLNANPYAFLDGGEAIERRARVAETRQGGLSDDADDYGKLDPAAIAKVIEEARPLIRNADELHDAILSRVAMPAEEVESYGEFCDQLKQSRRIVSLTLESGERLILPTERIGCIEPLWPDAEFACPDGIPVSLLKPWEMTEALACLLRGWMEIVGPVTVQEMNAQLHLRQSLIQAGLEALEGEGIVLRGQFRLSQDWNSQSGTNETETETEWCHRRLLARIHRLTVQGLRAQVAPVELPVLMRFLMRHQSVYPGYQQEGTEGLLKVIEQLAGIDFPAAAWEKRLLARRVQGYSPRQMDELGFSGEISWGRLTIPQPSSGNEKTAQKGKKAKSKARPMNSLTRATPLSLFPAETKEFLMKGASPTRFETLTLSAQQILELLQSHGAMFAAEIGKRAEMLPSQVTDVLGELIRWGYVTADGFSGLRGMLGEIKSDHPRAQALRRRRATQKRFRQSTGQTGRWSLLRNPTEEKQKQAQEKTPQEMTKQERLEMRKEHREWVEQWARLLLKRWGVVFRDLLYREQCAPRWFDLLMVYRQWEARGEVRGGRFVLGVAGEQFASAETLKQLRELRDQPDEYDLIMIPAVDPLNLVGILTHEARVNATLKNYVIYHQGEAVAAVESKQLFLLKELSPELQLKIQQKLDMAPRQLPQRKKKSTSAKSSHK